MILVAVLCGCSEPPPQVPPGQSPSGSGRPAGDTGMVPPPPPPPPPAQPPVRKKAEVGVGKKGHYGRSGPVTTPIAAKFRVEERLVFDVQIPQAMQLFKASEGRAPKSHEEFFKRIIRENNIKLPELPVGDRYVYDPQKEELMVESSP